MVSRRNSIKHLLFFFSSRLQKVFLDPEPGALNSFVHLVQSANALYVAGKAVGIQRWFRAVPVLDGKASGRDRPEHTAQTQTKTYNREMSKGLQVETAVVPDINFSFQYLGPAANSQHKLIVWQLKPRATNAVLLCVSLLQGMKVARTRSQKSQES